MSYSIQSYKFHPRVIQDLTDITNKHDNLKLTSTGIIYADSTCQNPLEQPISLELSVINDLRVLVSQEITVLDTNSYEIYKATPILIDDSNIADDGDTSIVWTDIQNPPDFDNLYLARVANTSWRPAGEFQFRNSVWTDPDVGVARDLKAGHLGIATVSLKVGSLSGIVKATSGVLSASSLLDTEIPLLDASKIGSGVFDLARIPALPSSNTIVCSTIPNMSVEDQALVSKGTVVIESLTGNTYRYSGSGSVILNASYIQQSDLTPDWLTITNKPTSFTPSAHTHAQSDIIGLDTALSGKANSIHTHLWADITDKPTSFTPISHGHDATEISTNSSYRFVSDAEKATWNAMSTHNHDATYLKLIGGTVTGATTFTNQFLCSVNNFRQTGGTSFIIDNNSTLAKEWDYQFHEWSTYTAPIFETFDGTVWSTSTLNNKLFDGYTSTGNSIISSTVLGSRFTWNTVAWASIVQVVICPTYSSPVSTITILIETSTNGTNWTNLNTWSGNTGIIPLYLNIADSAGNAYLRVSITTATYTGNVNFSSIRLMSNRLGDQGKYKFTFLPFSWDYNKKLSVVNINLSGQTASKLLATDSSKNLVSYTLVESDIPTLSATKITQTSSYRFVTDTEKSTWNAKQPAGNYSLVGHTHSWSDIISDKPTTLAGYGITDAVSSSDSRLTDARTPNNNAALVQGSVSNTGAFGKRTTYLGSGANNVDAIFDSGFYDTNSTTNPNGNWLHLINSAHNNNNTGNQYQFQIAASFSNSVGGTWGAENYWMRTNNPVGIGAWRKLWHDGNLVGDQGTTHTHSQYQLVSGMSAYQTVAGMSAYSTTAQADATYLKLVGGTMSGSINMGANGVQFGSVSLYKSGDNNWIHVNGNGFLPAVNNTQSLGRDDFRWNSVHSTTFYESGTALSAKYLGINAQAQTVKIQTSTTANSAYAIAWIGTHSVGDIWDTPGNLTWNPSTNTFNAINITENGVALSAKYQAKFAGTTAQYVRGDGSLATFPTLGSLAAKNTVAWTSDIINIPTGLAQVSTPTIHGNIKMGSTVVGSWHGIEFSDYKTTRLLINSSGATDAGVAGIYDGTATDAGWLFSFNRSSVLSNGYVPWARLQNVPSSFTPSAHTHAWSDIVSGKPTTLAGYGITDAVGSSDSRLSDARTPTAHTHNSLDQKGLPPVSSAAPSTWGSVGIDVRKSTNTGSYPSAFGNILTLAGDGLAQIQIGMNTGASPYNTGLWFRNSRDVVNSFSTWARVLDTSMDATSISQWNTAYTHSQATGNPHGTTIANISGLQSALDGKQAAGSYVIKTGDSGLGDLSGSGFRASRQTVMDSSAYFNAGLYIERGVNNSAYYAGIGFHNNFVNAAYLYYDNSTAGDATFRYRTHTNGDHAIWCDLHFSGTDISNWQNCLSRTTSLETRMNGVDANWVNYSLVGHTHTLSNISDRQSAYATPSNDVGTAQYLRWKNYGASHEIIDMSSGTAPDGTTHDRYNAENGWVSSFPNLMGWNGVNTYGVRVDSARVADDSSTLNGHNSSYFATVSSLANYVDLTSNQTITGTKVFGNASINTALINGNFAWFGKSGNNINDSGLWTGFIHNGSDCYISSLVGGNVGFSGRGGVFDFIINSTTITASLPINGTSASFSSTISSSNLSVSSGLSTPIFASTATSVNPWLSNMVAANLATGVANGRAISLIGASNALNNCAYFGFRYDGGSGSTSNKITLGLYANDDLVLIDGNGSLTAKGNIYAVGGSYTGALSGVSASFTGSLTADSATITGGISLMYGGMKLGNAGTYSSGMWSGSADSTMNVFGFGWNSSGPAVHMGTNSANYFNIIAGQTSIATFSSTGIALTKSVTANNGFNASNATITTANITNAIVSGALNGGCASASGGTDYNSSYVMITNVLKLTTGQSANSVKLPSAIANPGMVCYITTSGAYNYNLYSVQGSRYKLDATIVPNYTAIVWSVKICGWVSDGSDWYQIV